MTTSPLHSLDIRLLRYFAVVAEENNMSRAAQRLFMSQPPLSRHIRQLEERLGVTLFVRHTRGLTLTDEGYARWKSSARCWRSRTKRMLR